MMNRAFDRRWKSLAVVAISVIAIGACLWAWRNLDTSNVNQQFRLHLRPVSGVLLMR
jgi:hypothetical protein